MPRLVRDLSVELGKRIELEMLGSDTELDRQVLELIKDPLTHMVRNSADHGLEEPSERRAAGKSEQGTIVLNAFHEGGHIVIEISDDGAKGLLELRRSGAATIGQDEASCVVYGMPKEAAKLGAVALEVGLEQIPHEIVRFARRA